MSLHICMVTHITQGFMLKSLSSVSEESPHGVEEHRLHPSPQLTELTILIVEMLGPSYLIW